MNTLKQVIYFGLLFFLSISFAGCEGGGTTQGEDPIVTTPQNPSEKPEDPANGTQCNNNGITDNGEQGVDCGGGNCPDCHDVIIENELFIKHDAIVNSPEAKTGKFSFGQLFQNMAGTGNSNNPKDLLLNILTSWESDQTVNSFVSTKRESIRSMIIDPWKAADNQANVSDEDWNINWSNAPFKLLGITNRLDLGDQNTTSAGEGRFTYCVVNNNTPQQFTWIFEYSLPILNNFSSIEWAKAWHELSGIDNINSTEYFNKVVEVTDRFTKVNGAPNQVNGSAISQIRTNEVALRRPWELREFRLNNTGQFEQVVVQKNPDLSLQNDPDLRQFLLDNSAAIINGSANIPETLNNKPILGASALVASPTFKWEIPNLDNEVLRFSFSSMTCNGCHGGEFNNTLFTHIKPPATLNGIADASEFLEMDLESRQQKLRTKLQIQAMFPGPIAASRSLEDETDEIRKIKSFIDSPASANRVH